MGGGTATGKFQQNKNTLLNDLRNCLDQKVVIIKNLNTIEGKLIFVEDNTPGKRAGYYCNKLQIPKKSISKIINGQDKKIYLKDPKIYEYKNFPKLKQLY